MAVVNIGLATEVLKFSDELCVNWKMAVESRKRLDKVKAQSYIDKFESKLCDACVACEAALDGVKACLAVATEDKPSSQGADGYGSSEEDHGGSAAGAATIAALLRLVIQAAGVARSEGWGCADLLDAVSRDVVTFSKNVGLPSRLAPSPWLPGRRKAESRVSKNLASSAAAKFNKNAYGKGRGAGTPFLAVSNGASRRVVHRPKDAVRLQSGKLGYIGVAKKKTVNRHRPNRPPAADQSGPLDLAVGSIKYDMSANPFVRR